MTTIRTHLFRIIAVGAVLILVGATTVAAGGQQEEQQREEDRGTRIELGEDNGAPDDRQSRQPVDETPDRFEGATESQNAENTAPAWLIGRHPLDDQLEPTISGNIERGYVPVGLDMKTGDVTVLYLLTDRIEFDRWTIQKIEDARDMNATVTAWLRDGWMPLDFALVPDGIAFLLVETDHDIDSWRIEVIPPDTETIEETYAAYQAEGYVPYGLASNPNDEQIWLLFLRAEGVFQIPAVSVEGFPTPDVVTGVNGRYSAGSLPWAMSVLPGSYLIQFIEP